MRARIIGAVAGAIIGVGLLALALLAPVYVFLALMGLIAAAGCGVSGYCFVWSYQLSFRDPSGER